MAENFQKLWMNTKPSSENTKENNIYLHLYLFLYLLLFFQEARRGKYITFRRIGIRITEDYSSVIMKARRGRNEIFIGKKKPTWNSSKIILLK